MVKNLPDNSGDTGSIPGLGRFPWRRKWRPTPVFLPGKSHGQRSLVGYSPWGHDKSDTVSDSTHKGIQVRQHAVLGRTEDLSSHRTGSGLCLAS